MQRRPALLAALVLALAACASSDPIEVDTGGDTLVELTTTSTAPPVTRGTPVTAQEPSTTTTHPPSTTTTTSAPPPPVVTEPPPPRPTTPSRCGGWAELVARHFPPEQVATACRVMLCESRGDPTIANEAGSGASGLWQFLGSTWRSVTGLNPPASAYSPDRQTAAAAALWRSSGWGQWSCY